MFCLKAIPDIRDLWIGRFESVIEVTEPAFGTVGLQDLQCPGLRHLPECVQPTAMRVNCTVQAVEKDLVIQHVKCILNHASHDLGRFFQMLFDRL